MIKEIICYTLLCDNCGQDLNAGQEVSGWTDVESNEEIAQESGWLFLQDQDAGQPLDDEKHYCPDCWAIGDDDEVIVKTPQP